MTFGRSIYNALVCLAIVGTTAACSIPGIRPEGRTARVTASSPAGRSDVYSRAREWFVRNEYGIVSETTDAEIHGVRTISRDGDVETRAVVELVLITATLESTSYRATSHTERGRPPLFRRIDQNAPEAGAAVGALVAYLSCPAARWPRCP